MCVCARARAGVCACVRWCEGEDMSWCVCEGGYVLVCGGGSMREKNVKFTRQERFVQPNFLEDRSTTLGTDRNVYAID
jgi:hypothetical protein